MQTSEIEDVCSCGRRIGPQDTIRIFEGILSCLLCGISERRVQRPAVGISISANSLNQRLDASTQSVRSYAGVNIEGSSV